MDIADKLAGVFAPISTPFAEDESLDLAALRHNLAFYAESGIKGYVALGSNGENRSLTEEEKLTVLETIIAFKGADQIVIAGAVYEAQRDAERFFKQAAGFGADFGLLLPPSYFSSVLTDDLLYRYYVGVAEASPVPILLYNAPKFAPVTLSPELVGRLAHHPKIVGIKDSASSGIEHFIAATDRSFHVSAGSISFLFPAMMAGAVGGAVSLANSFPKIALELYHLGLARDIERGEAYQAWARKVNRSVSGQYGVAGVKAAMNLAGLKGGIPRRPLLPLSAEQQEEIKTLLIAEGVL
ncbi:MAG: dihydrodipicolinate synthase family protein [Anaerolineae bacterium]|nr:dihydrodipicolinate synthase family protein [Anaerolineae bacterium]